MFIESLLALSLVCMGEARGDPASREQVIQTVIARYYSPIYPSTIAGVVYQPNQFAPASAPPGRRASVITKQAYRECQELAHDYLTTYRHPDAVASWPTHFHSGPARKISWASSPRIVRLFRRGQHVFYRDIRA